MLSKAESIVHGQSVGVFIVLIFGKGKNIEAQFLLNSIDSNVWGDGRLGYVCVEELMESCDVFWWIALHSVYRRPRGYQYFVDLNSMPGLVAGMWPLNHAS